MDRFITLSDGSIQFLTRGEPPKSVPGYEVDPGDPFRFHLIMAPCQHRTYQLFVLKCCPGATKNVRHCTKHGYLAMHPKVCNLCIADGMND